MNKTVLTTVTVVAVVGVVGFLAWELYMVKAAHPASTTTAPAQTTAPASGSNANNNQWATIIGDVTGLFN